MTDVLAALIKEAAFMGAAQAIARMLPKEDRISQRRAEAMFGRAFLRRNAGRLNVYYNGNRKEYSKSECEQLRHGESAAAIVAKIDQAIINESLKKRKNG